MCKDDIEFLRNVLRKNGKTNLANYASDQVLFELYSIFSETVWCASWEDNAEGEFIDWLDK